MNYFRCRCIIFIFLLLFDCIKWITASQANFTAAIQQLISSGEVTDEQVKRWWYYTQAKQRGFPRTFPFCFDTNEELPGKAELFRERMKKLNDLTEYDPELDGWPSHKKMENLFDSITYNRITIQASKPNPNIFGPRVKAEGLDPFKLYQLLDFKVTFKEGIRGLYVQAYGGPMGVPTGEFLSDLKCTDGEKDDSNYPLNMNVVPCHYAPRTAFIHPNVFIFDTETRSKVAQVQFRFRWTETQCHETAFFQFIMLATKDFQTFSSVLSPVFYYKLEKASAVPTPYHPYHDKVTCTNMKDQAIITSWDGSRIMPNKQYDECILKGTDRNQNLEDFTCPPGQFKCDMTWNSVAGWQTEMDLWSKEFVVSPTSSVCCNIVFSTLEPPDQPTDTREPTHQEKQENFLKEVILRSEKRQQITHGDFCLLVWMVLVPLANLISRFFKDFAEISSLGLGFWIVGHFALHTIGIIMVWWSFGLVVGGGQDRLGNVSGRHFLLGIIATAIQHAQFLTGLRRQEENERKIFNYVLIHSVGGYFSHFVAYIAVLLSNADPERKYFSLGLFAIWLVATVAFHLAEMRQDRILGVVLHRAQCPVLQRIVIDGGRPPMFKTKIVILVVTFIACISLYIFMKVYFSLLEEIITGQEVQEIENTTPDPDINETDARFIVLN